MAAKSDELRLTSRDGRRYRLRYRAALPLDVGTAYVGDAVVGYGSYVCG